MFHRAGEEPSAAKDLECVCEDCYKSYHHGDERYIKAYKHCALNKSITREASRRICRCPGAQQFDETGNQSDIFPISDEKAHIGPDGSSSLRCGLLKLGENIAEAKYHGMEGKYTQHKQSHKLTDVERQVAETQERNKKKKAKQARKTKRYVEPQKPPTGVKEAQEDVPSFLGNYTEKFPFANVHMSLRLGPLVIENGVAQ